MHASIRSKTRALAATLVVSAALVATAIGLTAIANPFEDSGGPGRNRVRVGTPAWTTSTTVPASPSPLSVAAVVTAPPACGTTFPAELNVPEGYAGPFTEVHPSTFSLLDLNVTAGSLALTWQSASGTVELRWPAFDGESLLPRPSPGHVVGPSPSRGDTGGNTFPMQTFPDGRFSIAGYFEATPPELSNFGALCQICEWRVVDTDANRVNAVATWLNARPLRERST